MHINITKIRVLSVTLIAMALLTEAKTVSAQEAKTDIREEDKKKFLQAFRNVNPPTITTNWGTRAVWLTLSDLKTKMQLPAGWSCYARGAFFTDPDGTRSGLFYHYFYRQTGNRRTRKALRPTSKTPGFLFQIVYDGEGGNRQLLHINNVLRARYFLIDPKNEPIFQKLAQENPQEKHETLAQRRYAFDRTVLRALRWRGLDGYYSWRTDGVLLSTKDIYPLGLSLPVRRFYAVSGEYRTYSLSDTTRRTAATKAAFNTLFNSFRP